MQTKPYTQTPVCFNLAFLTNFAGCAQFHARAPIQPELDQTKIRAVFTKIVPIASRKVRGKLHANVAAFAVPLHPLAIFEVSGLVIWVAGFADHSRHIPTSDCHR
ncbi:MAG: hypothetical protein ACLPSW_00040 [Roseiarcus sp.]